MNKTIRTLRAVAIAIVILAPPISSAVWAEEERVLRPEIEQLTQTVSEKLQAAADKLGLTSEQKDKIAAIRTSRAEQLKALRAERRSLLQDELKAISSILTPQQRDKVKELAEDRLEQAEPSGSRALPRFVVAHATLAERLEAAADKLGLSAAQRRQIAEVHAQFAGKYLTLRSERRELLKEELKEVATVLTPEQRAEIKDVCEDRIIVAEVSSADRDKADSEAAIRESIAERLEAVSDKLGLTAEQRTKIRDIHASLAGKFKSQREQRRALRGEELKALTEILTPEQLKQAKDFVEDRTTGNRAA
jgi:Spy/CpxP family protein refolding chaperone